MKKIKYVSLCSGYGAECIAMKRLKRDFPDFDFECLAWSEIEPTACKAHDAIHEEYAGRNLGDMTTCDYSGIETPIDVLFYSTPCQSVSTAGKQAGMKKGDDSAASALIWHTERAIRELHPRICILENVRGMISKRNRPDFAAWCKLLESYGYANFWQVLNSKNYGVPQNRERVFMISIKRTEADPNPTYNFPKPFPLEKRLKDVLETNVDESYYLKQEQVDKIIEHCERKQAEGCGFKTNFPKGEGIYGTIMAKYGGRETDTYIKESQVVTPPPNQPLNTQFVNATSEGIAPTLCANYYKMSLSNFTRSDGRRATAVIEEYDEPTESDTSVQSC